MRQFHRVSFAVAVTGAALAVSSTSHAQITGKKTDDVPVAQAERELVLPHLTLAPRFDATYNHIEVLNFASNGAVLELGAQLGLLGDLELEATAVSLMVGDFVVSPITYLDDAGSINFLTGDVESGADWGVFRLGATLRFLATDVVEIGGRFRFSVDNNAVIGLNFGVPIRIHVGDVLRIDTGLDIHPRFPTSGGDPVFGLIGIDDNAFRPSPGIPIDFVINPVDAFWLNFGTGFGVADVSEDNSIFLPLEMGLGVTVPNGKKALVDIGANFAFPLLFTPAEDDKATTNFWQIGLGAKGYIPLQ